MPDLILRLAGGMRTAGRAVLDLLLPPQCLTCDAPVDVPGRFCAACFVRAGFITEPCCDRCGTPFGRPSDGGPESICHVCRADPPPWTRARGALRYEAQGRNLVLPLKYADRLENAAALAPFMLRAGIALVRGADVLVPVPLHRRRLLARRYNQAALLARAVARLGAKPALLDALLRTRVTVPLADLSAEERAREVHAAFAVRPSRQRAIAGKRVLLIDDVLTSGATARACTLTLLAAGAACVDVLVAARVRDPRHS